MLALGRQGELGAVAASLSVPGPRAVVIEGPAGIGKSTVWRAAGAAAAQCGWRVLAVRPREIEAAMPFAALQGLFDGCLDEVAEVLPPPQRAALDVALFRAARGEGPLDPGVVAAATLSAIRALGKERALLVAIDDAQWLDPASAQAIAFAARRLSGEPIRLLVAWRSQAGPADLGLDATELATIRIGALAPQVLRQIVREQLGSVLPMSAARGLHRLSGGNPFYALELARAHPDAEYRFDQALSLDDVRSLVGRRFAELPVGALPALATVAAMTAPDVHRIREVLTAEASLDMAFTLDILTESGHGRIDFTHPLLAAAAYAAVPPRRRRAIHTRLADSAPTVEERARHLAIATISPEPKVAATIQAGAQAAAARGAVADAGRMYEIAARITPRSDRETVAARRLAAARCYLASGDVAQAVAIWTDLAAGCPPGETHAEALTQLAYNGVVEHGQALAMCDRAVAESTTTRSRIQRMAIQAHVLATSDQQGALAPQRTALAEARAVADEIALCTVLPQLGFQTALSTSELDGVPLLREAMELDRRHPGAVPAYLAPQNLLGIVLVQRNELPEARALLGQHIDSCIARGDEGGACGVAIHQAEAELRAGNLDGAQAAIDFALSIADNGQPSQNLCMVLAFAALVAAHRGDRQRVPALLARVAAMTELAGDPHTACAQRVAAGYWELSLGNNAAALDWLEPTVAIMRSVGYVEPGVYFFLPDRLEALIVAGRYIDAQRDIARWEATGRRYDRAFALATGARPRGMLLAAQGNLAEAVDAFAEAITHHQRLDWPHQHGRTLLAYGSTLRRAGRRKAARAHLDAARQIFDRIGEPLWSKQTRDELARLGGRTPAGQTLTDGERRVAELVACGHINREVAAELNISTKTVEAVLTRVYAKLNVRSRTELAARWPTSRQSIIR